jgi:hypothetical protein
MPHKIKRAAEATLSSDHNPLTWQRVQVQQEQHPLRLGQQARLEPEQQRQLLRVQQEQLHPLQRERQLLQVQHPLRLGQQQALQQLEERLQVPEPALLCYRPPMPVQQAWRVQVSVLSWDILKEIERHRSVAWPASYCFMTKKYSLLFKNSTAKQLHLPIAELPFTASKPAH